MVGLFKKSEAKKSVTFDYSSLLRSGLKTKKLVVPYSNEKATAKYQMLLH
jgi:hypothetical protein